MQKYYLPMFYYTKSQYVLTEFTLGYYILSPLCPSLLINVSFYVTEQWFDLLSEYLYVSYNVMLLAIILLATLSDITELSVIHFSQSH